MEGCVKELEHKILIQTTKSWRKKDICKMKTHFNNWNLWFCTKITALLILTAIFALVLKTLGLPVVKLNLPMYEDIFLKWILLACDLSSTHRIWTVAELSSFPLNTKDLHTWLTALTQIYTHAHTCTNTCLLCNTVMFPCYPWESSTFTSILGALIIFSNF